MSKKRSYTPVAKIKNALRRIHLHDKQRTIAKNRSKIDKALYKCEAEGCHICVYEGASEKNFISLADKYKGKYELVKGKIELNHSIPVAPTERYDEVVEDLQKNLGLLKLLNVDKVYVKGLLDLMIYISRLWVSEDSYDCMCSWCHAKVTEQQVKDRVKKGSLKRSKK